jgi:hypothetical protein
MDTNSNKYEDDAYIKVSGVHKGKLTVTYRQQEP